MKYTEQEQRTATQRLINEAYAHIQTTKTKSVDPNHPRMCTYSGSGCAFSPAIQPECRECKHLRSDKASTVIVQKSKVLYSWAKAICPDIADQVQGCHDHSISDPEMFWERFRARLKTVCNDEGYDYPGDTA